MAVYSGSPALRQLIDALGIPEHCVEFHLIAKLNEIVTVQATYHPDIRAEAITKRFRLVEIEDDASDANR